MSWRIALSDIDLGEAEIAAVERVLRSKWLSMGPLTAEFESAFAAFVGARHAIAVANCTVALHLAYAALGLGPGDEVIMPALTFVATANALLLTGATPVFADVRGLDDLTLDPDAVAALITPRTRAIAVMHYGGYACDMDALTALAVRHGLAVVEDAAHAPGGALGGRMLGTIGDVGCFSFFANKNIATGEGGMIVTDRDDLAARMRLLRSHGMTTLTWERHRGHAASYDVVANGFNYRLDDLHAALGRAQLSKLPDMNARRSELARHYAERLRSSQAWTMAFAHNIDYSANHLMVVTASNPEIRNAGRTALAEAGIQTSLHYPCIPGFEVFASSKTNVGIGKAFAFHALSLPLYPELTITQVDEIVDILESASASQR